jgi:hypothetical protein
MVVPLDEPELLLLELPPQAARAVAPTAASTAIFVPVRANLIICPPG